ncbi:MULTISPECIES: hypothetical protein [Flammeovirga]|uniref:Transmembrane protein n=1 Tax=Flammeovirga agarivorans TaxID=2726742 RepID=A0A7X8SLB8_9BACT|nr:MULTISPECIES: hypothetical protein [Flammeovirga]NLR92339.1 hypothetical protein [Flammeovirga agarivorans]
MNKNDFIYSFTIIITSSLLQVLFPWWIIFLPCFVYGIFAGKNNFLKSFLIGFICIAFLWGSYAAIIQLYTHSELSSRIATMFTVPTNDFIGMITAIVGGVVGGLSSLCGDLVKWASVDLKPVKRHSDDDDD